MLDSTHRLLASAAAALDLSPSLEDVTIAGEGALPSAFAVTGLAAASIGVATLAVRELVAHLHGERAAVAIDRRRASLWFARSVAPIGWTLPEPWDAIAGDYATRDGWIRLHTNAARHRAAALAVLGCPGERAAVAAAVGDWSAQALEDAVVEHGGCAAALRSAAQWRQHPQGQAVAAEPLVAWSFTAAPPRPAARAPRERPLSGVKVLDLTRVLAGPVATRFLAGHGAAVLRIDPPGWDEPALAPDVTLGKRCARLDLEQAADRVVFEHLLAGADVLVHGYRPGALDALGYATAARRALNPGLVDVALDAYGWSGPWRERRGFDSLVQMSTGIAQRGMEWQRAAGPFPLPVQALDHATGYLMAAAVVRGLTHRAVDGRVAAARLSLARTAGLLQEVTPDEDAAAITPRDDDYAPAIEQTAWGPARRLRGAASLAGLEPAWTLPAGPLGSAPAQWPHA